MKLNYVTVMVRGIEKSPDFYCELLPLKVVSGLNPPQGRIAFVADQKGDTMPKVCVKRTLYISHR